MWRKPLARGLIVARLGAFDETDKKILIPLTSSLYIPGRIKDTENVLVDVGTGYFVEKVRVSL